MIGNRNGKKGMRAMAVLLSALMIFGLGGCGGSAGQGGDTDPEPIDGGTTNKTDANAPKHIESKDITDLDASFYLNTRWSGDQDGRFRFVISGEDGSLTAREETRGVSVPADKELLDELQAVIDRYDLAKQNGVYEVTAGLPPEYQEGWLTVDYASGEKLAFTTNNNPYAMWAEDFYDVLSAWFLSKGVDSLEPDPEDSLIERLDIRFERDGRFYDYGGIKVSDADAIDGETLLLNRAISESGTYSEISDDYIVFPDDYYEKVTGIIARTDLVKKYDFSAFNHEAMDFSNHDLGFYGLGGFHPDYSEPDSEDLFVDIYIKYESGTILNIETKKAGEIEGLRPLLDELIEYHDSLF